MSAAASNHPAVEQIVAQLEAQRLAEGRRRKWFWASLLVRLFMLWQAFNLAMLSVSLFTRLAVGGLVSDPAVSPWVMWLEAASTAFGPAVAILIGAWALRYCRARSDETAGRTVSR